MFDFLIPSVREDRELHVPSPTTPDAVLRIAVCPDTSTVGRSFPLRGKQNLVGRDTFNAVSLNDPGVSRQHVMLDFTESGHELHDLSSTNGTMVNGRKVGRKVLLNTGDTIRLGATKLVYERGNTRHG